MKTDPVIKQRIHNIVIDIGRTMRLLESYVHEMNNSMNECDCGDRRAFDFRNISTESEWFILCIHCGGYIEPKDLEDCGIF